MTALTIAQNAASRLGITAPLALFSSTDDQTIQLRNLINQEGIELSKGAGTDHAWTKLITEKTFTTVAAAIQTSAIPTDFNWYINETMWNRTTMVQMSGPASASEWQAFQAISVVSLPNAVFRFRGSDLLIYPSPTAGQTAAYEYVSTFWAQNASGSGLAAMTADDDVGVLDENLITLGAIWRFLAAKGLDYAEPFRTYQIELGKAVSRDGGKRKYTLSGPTAPRYPANIPESGWPG